MVIYHIPFRKWFQILIKAYGRIYRIQTLPNYIKEIYKDGGLNVLQVEYYQNGQLKEKGNLKFGRQDGLWEYFNEDGALLRTETYNDN